MSFFTRCMLLGLGMKLGHMVGWTELLCEQGGYLSLPSRSLEHMPHPQLLTLEGKGEHSTHSECS